jgi:regulatory protein
MHTVTSVRPRGRQQRWTVHLDGEPWIVVDADLRTKYALHEGEPVSPETRAQAMREAAQLAAHDRATRMLAARGRSARDLGRRLVGKGIGAAEAEKAVDRLRRVGLVDDARFAVHYARQKASAGHGRRRIAGELSRQGVDESHVRTALDDAFSDAGVDAEGQLWSVASRRWQGLARLEPQVRQRRLTAFLARRGHGMDAIRRVLQRLHQPETRS